MLTRKRYRRPPLVEVFADFSFNEDLPWDTLRLVDFYRAIGGTERYPDRRDPDPAKKPRGERHHRPGSRLWQFLSAGGERVVQVGPHKLVLNQLPPYYGWQQFREEAEQVIHAYLKHWQPDVVESASLNYVDVIDIPGNRIMLSEYFNFFPVLPPSLVQRGVRDLTLACQFEGDDKGEMLAVSMHNNNEEESPLVFRLQWHYVATHANPASLAGMLAWLDKAHERTSEAFRASLTPRCERLFDPE